MNYLQQAVDHALPAGSDAFDLFAVPLHVNFREMQDAMLAGQFTLASPCMRCARPFHITAAIFC